MIQYRLSEEDFDFLARAIERIDQEAFARITCIESFFGMRVSMTERNRIELSTIEGIVDVVSRSEFPWARIFYIKNMHGHTSIVSRCCNLIPVE